MLYKHIWRDNEQKLPQKDKQPQISFKKSYKPEARFKIPVFISIPLFPYLYIYMFMYIFYVSTYIIY